MNDFSQPQLDDTPTNTALPETVAPVAVDNTGKTDELSLAVQADQVRNPIFIAAPVAVPCKYALTYNLDGLEIEEQHATIDGAVARVRALKVLNIIPATHTL